MPDNWEFWDTAAHWSPEKGWGIPPEWWTAPVDELEEDDDDAAG